MTYSFGISPCPNDTYIFAAIINKWIDTKGFNFEFQYHDVQELNQLCCKNDLDFSKISIHAFVDLIGSYQMLSNGGALGNGVGPLLIRGTSKLFEKIALPGKQTTAHFLYNFYADSQMEEAPEKQFLRFDLIEDALLQSKVDLGVIIHENRFTYAQRGLSLVQDLGAHWENATKLPIPLGGLVLRNDLIRHAAIVEDLVRESIDYAAQHRSQVMDFVKLHAQEMDQEVMQKHIDLYVNKYSYDLGLNGRSAIEYLLDYAIKDLNGSEAGKPTKMSDKNIFANIH